MAVRAACTRFCAWSPRRWAGRSPRPPSAKPASVFPLGSLRWLWGRLVGELTARTGKRRWRGLRLLAADHTALSLPETRALYQRFGAHKGKKGLGPITVEFACLFHLWSRAPYRYAFGPCKTSDHDLLRALLPGVRKGDLLLLDSGFYSLAAFLLIRHRLAHFLIPMKKSGRPRVLRQLGPSDYLCRIESGGQSLTVRVIFVYRDGFRRRRLVTSLLDPHSFPASELAQIYHQRG